MNNNARNLHYTVILFFITQRIAQYSPILYE